MHTPSTRKGWRRLAASVGLIELALMLATIVEVTQNESRPPDLRILSLAQIVLLGTPVLGGLAAFKLGRRPVPWALGGVLFWGAPFLVLAWLGPMSPGVFERKRVRKAVRGGDEAALRKALEAGFPVETPLSWLTGYTALMEAVIKAKPAIARALLQAGASPHAPDSQGTTPLMVACAGGNAELVRLLLDRGADPRARSKGGTPLSFAIEFGHADVVRALLEAGLSAHEDVGSGQQALSLAEKRGKADVLRLLRERHAVERFEQSVKEGKVAQALEWLADPNAKLPGGRTPLIVVAAAGHLEAVSKLLAARADPNGKDASGRTALMAAAEANAATVAERLLAAGVSPDSADPRGETPLLVACRRGNLEAARVLLRAGANPNARDSQAALILATQSGRWELERDLIAAGATRDAAYDAATARLCAAAVERGAAAELEWRLAAINDLEARQRCAAAGLVVAARQGQVPLAETLIKAGAHIHTVDEQGRTPVWIAIDSGHASLVERLIQAGADVDASKALLTVCRRGHASLARMFLRAGADPNARDGGGSALLLAAKAGMDELERDLLSAGAVADEAYQKFRETRDRERRVREEPKSPPPAYSKKCQKCGQSFSFTEAQIESLSRVEQMICAKEGLDFSRMVKVTCRHCGTPSLAPRSQFQEAGRRDPRPGGEVPHELAPLIAKVNSLASRAFDAPGPLFDESRRQILTQWLGNFARNLQAVATALRDGRDMSGHVISAAQAGEGLQRMCDEYGKSVVLQRLEHVCGAGVRREFEAVLKEATALAAALRRRA